MALRCLAAATESGPDVVQLDFRLFELCCACSELLVYVPQKYVGCMQLGLEPPSPPALNLLPRQGLESRVHEGLGFRVLGWRCSAVRDRCLESFEQSVNSKPLLHLCFKGLCPFPLP